MNLPNQSSQFTAAVTPPLQRQLTNGLANSKLKLGLNTRKLESKMTIDKLKKEKDNTLYDKKFVNQWHQHISITQNNFNKNRAFSNLDANDSVQNRSTFRNKDSPSKIKLPQIRQLANQTQLDNPGQEQKMRAFNASVL